jgi:hypothetical protein
VEEVEEEVERGEVEIVLCCTSDVADCSCRPIAAAPRAVNEDSAAARLQAQCSSVRCCRGTLNLLKALPAPS